MAGECCPFVVTNRYLELHKVQPPTVMDRFSPAEKRTTLDVTAPLPAEKANLISSQLQKLTENQDDFRDEYFTSSILGMSIVLLRSTIDDYFVHEQDQKDIIVRNRLRNHFEFWTMIYFRYHFLFI